MIVAIYFCGLSFAETIKLKNGRIFDGDIIEKTDEYIKFYFRGVILKYHLDEIESIGNQESLGILESGKINTESLFPVDIEKAMVIGINSMVKLDFKTKSEIYNIRKNYILGHPELIKVEYVPSEDVFGQIVDNKPWWGILGLSYYGPGQQSIKGPSEESRFLVNPFLLVGLDSGHGLVVDDKNLTPIPIYPEPISLIWYKDRSLGKVKYNLSNFWSKQQKYHDPTVSEHKLVLIAYNARDLGFNYLYVDSKKSKNIPSCGTSNQAMLIKYFIHCGGSCGYPGGCNNMSPNDPDFQVKVYSVPALLYIKLWRNKPVDINQMADMVFVIEMI